MKTDKTIRNYYLTATNCRKSKHCYHETSCYRTPKNCYQIIKSYKIIRSYYSATSNYRKNKHCNIKPVIIENSKSAIKLSKPIKQSEITDQQPESVEKHKKKDCRELKTTH